MRGVTENEATHTSPASPTVLRWRTTRKSSSPVHISCVRLVVQGKACMNLSSAHFPQCHTLRRPCPSTCTHNVPKGDRLHSLDLPFDVNPEPAITLLPPFYCVLQLP
ncbi:unnamed protein product, partial [Ectocarpus fasciculatus]